MRKLSSLLPARRQRGAQRGYNTWIRLLTVGVAVACLTSLATLLPAPRADAAIPPNIAWSLPTAPGGRCYAEARISKPMTAVRIDAMRKAAARTGTLFLENSNSITLKGESHSCTHQTTGGRRVLLSVSARNIIAAVAGVVIAGAAAILAPEAITLAARAAGVAISQEAAAGLAACVGAGVGAVTTQWIRGQNSVKELGVSGTIACAGGAAASWLGAYQKARQALIDAQASIAATVGRVVGEDVASVAHSAASDLASFGDVQLVPLASPIGRAVTDGLRRSASI